MPTNLLRTGVLLAVLTAIFVSMGWLIGGAGGMVIAFLIALGINLFSLWNSDKIVLRMFGAQEVGSRDAPDLTNLVGQLAQRAGLPMPKVYVMHNAQPNAFATGRSPSRAAVAVSTGLLEALSREELAGVIAHELAHIRNRDTLTMTVAATIAGAISMVANFLQFSMLFGGRRDNGHGGWIGALVAILVAPFAAMLVQMAISRSREYEADRVGAAIAGNPIWLANALRKIQGSVRRIPNQDAEAVPAAAHLFIINPLTGQGMDNLFSTHPNTENRIAELERLAQEWRQSGTRPSELDLGAEAAPSGPWAGSGSSQQGGARGPWG